MQNLFGNAIKDNLADSWIKLHAQCKGTTVAITISDASNVISVGDRDRVFDRSDPARTREVEGIGLGLSLSHQIVCAHGGSRTLGPIASGQTAFTLTLPTTLGAD